MPFQKSLALACAVGLGLTLGTPASAADTKPTLIVQVTIDQFREDYMTRLAPAYTGGLKRLLDQGARDLKGTVDHAISNSFPGHTALATGAYPRTHGLPANEWWVFRDGKWTWLDGGSDETTHFVGQPDRPSASPARIRVPSLGEWVKAADPDARSISLAASEIAVSYGGHVSDGTYWYDGRTMAFTTSSYYGDSLPGWLQAFNAGRLPDYRIQVWDTVVLPKWSSLAEADARPFENGGRDVSFPHRFDSVFDPSSDNSRDRQYAGWLAGTPMRDMALLELAAVAVKAEMLGQRGSTDYLSVALSATDSIGHTFGGRSQEALDAMLRVDRALGTFLDFLDATVGKDAYVLAVAGDHGAPDAIEQLLADGKSARRVSVEELDALLDDIDALARAHEGNEASLTAKIEALLEAQSYIADAVTDAEVMGLEPTDNPAIELYRKTWISDRIPDFPLWTTVPNREHHPARYGIYVQFRENTYFDFATVVHGSVYAYDRTVPIFFMGGDVKPGAVEGARTIDVAPTLANLAGIPVPARIDGKELKLYRGK